MTGPPRSQSLIRFVSTGPGLSPIWASPAGYVTLIKSLFVWNRADVESAVDLNLLTGDTASSMTIVHLVVPSTENASWDGWAVLNPGDSAFLGFDAVNVHVWLSGAVLAGGNQFPPATREQPTQLPGNPRPETPTNFPSPRQ